MRAYLTVTIGTALYQQRRGPGQTDLKFEGRANLLNTGNTPARNVRIRTTADILPIPILKDFQFSLPDENETKDEGVVGAHQTYIISGIVKDFVPDSEVAGIKEGSRKPLPLGADNLCRYVRGEPPDKVRPMAYLVSKRNGVWLLRSWPKRRRLALSGDLA
jgi:hypothetical protein